MIEDGTTALSVENENTVILHLRRRVLWNMIMVYKIMKEDKVNNIH